MSADYEPCEHERAADEQCLECDIEQYESMLSQCEDDIGSLQGLLLDCFKEACASRNSPAYKAAQGYLLSVGLLNQEECP